MLTNIVDKESGLNNPSIMRAIQASKLSRWHMSQTKSSPRALLPFPKKSYTGYYTYDRTTDDKMMSSVSIIENPHFYYNNDIIAKRDENGNSTGYKEKSELCLELRLNNEVEKRDGRSRVRTRFVYFGFNGKKLEFVVDSDSAGNIKAVKPEEYLVELENNTLKIYKMLHDTQSTKNSNPRYRLRLGTEKIPETVRKCLPDAIDLKSMPERAGSQPAFREANYGSWSHVPNSMITRSGTVYKGGTFRKDLSNISSKVYAEMIRNPSYARELNRCPLPGKMYVEYDTNKRTAKINIIYVNQFAISDRPIYGEKYFNKYSVEFRNGKIHVDPTETRIDASEKDIMRARTSMMKRLITPHAKEFKDLPREVIEFMDPELKKEIYKSRNR